MGMPVRIEDDLYRREARRKAECRSIGGQVEFWRGSAKRRSITRLPAGFVIRLLRARKEPRDKMTEFKPGQHRA